ncbi:cyclase family protein [Rahnella sp. C60]|uniref:cyclase family protein n=1 Tax=Rahnella TaxID=34037 RepID=UPI00101F1AFC|nr:MULTISPECIES: cyclase family protein [Rahnella]MBU9810413.1 cyclase family protein [Rahnella perminowiae]MBU9814912.1 cyclase family protein [Rahnella perminowiae]
MTRIEIVYRGRTHIIHHQESIKLSAQLCFADNAVNLYGIAPAYEAPLKYENSQARVTSGGACNASLISFVPHCHGTHTECIGHILPEIHNVADLSMPLFMAATLIHVSLERVSKMKDRYNTHAEDNDWIITEEAINHALTPLGSDYLQALVITTDDKSWLPDGNGAPYFSHQAMERVLQLGVQHLFVDIPSIDKLHDGGLMDNHRCFWGMADPCNPITERRQASVTELIQLPEGIFPGHYFISLQLPDLTGDALPSKPLLFPFS